MIAWLRSKLRVWRAWRADRPYRRVEQRDAEELRPVAEGIVAAAHRRYDDPLDPQTAEMLRDGRAVMRPGPGPDVAGAAIRRAEEQQRRELEASRTYGSSSVQAEAARLGL